MLGDMLTDKTPFRHNYNDRPCFRCGALPVVEGCHCVEDDNDYGDDCTCDDDAVRANGPAAWTRNERDYLITCIEILPSAEQPERTEYRTYRATSIGEALTMAERDGVADYYGIQPDDRDAARREGIAFDDDGMLIDCTCDDDAVRSNGPNAMCPSCRARDGR